MVTEFEQTRSKEETKEVLQEKADSAEKEVIRLSGILNKIIEQGRVGEDIHRMQSLFEICMQDTLPLTGYLFCSWWSTNVQC